MSMRGSKKVLAMLAACFASALATTTLALITDFSVAPNPPIIGTGLIGTATNDGKDAINSYKWEYQYVGPTGPRGQCKTTKTSWDQGPLRNPSSSLYCAFPGTYDLFVTADYKKIGPPDPPPPTTLGPKVISIAPADSFSIIAGLNTPVANNASIDFVFQVKSGGNPVGVYISGTAQEKLTDIIFLGNNVSDIGWNPPAATPTFYLLSGEIHDIKGTSLSSDDWNNLNNGDVFSTFTQHL